MQQPDRKVVLRALSERTGGPPARPPGSKHLCICAIALLWSVAGSSLCCAADGIVYKVNIFEVTLESSEPADATLKGVLQRHLQQSLEGCVKCHVEVVTSTMQSAIMKDGSLEIYLHALEVRYIVKSRLVSLGSDLDILVELEDHSQTPVLIKHWHRRVKKELDIADRLFGKFARGVVGVVEGTVQRDMVLAYCFFGLQAKDEAMAQFILFLPRKLEAALRARSDFARSYEVEGIPVTSLETECNKSRDLEARVRRLSSSPYEYVIMGVVEEAPGSRNVTLNVEVFSADVEQPTTLDPLPVNWGNQEILIQRLVTHIVSGWPRR